MTDATAAIPAIDRELELAASPDRVWQAISDPAEMALWFPQRAEWDLRPGGDGVFFWEGHGNFPIRIEAVDAPRYLAWRWAVEAEEDPDVAESATLVEWWVEGRPDGGTTLRLRESGFRVETHRSGNDEGWTEELAELSEMLTRD